MRVDKVEPLEMVTPDFLKQYAGLGNENVTREDMVVPRLALLQALSPELDSGNAKYLEGAGAGNIVHQVTGQVFKTGVYLVNAYYEREFAVFIKRSEGGGFRGTFPTEQEANAFLIAHPDSAKMEVVEQHLHYCLLLDENKVFQSEALVTMKVTQCKVSRKWNSLIDPNAGGPRFAKIWKLGSIKETNSKNQPFHNYTVAPAGWVTPELAEMAKALHAAIKAGEKTADRNETHVEVEY